MALSPSSVASTTTVPWPETVWAGVEDPYAALVPHSKSTEVPERRGFTVPLRMADVLVTADAAPVLTPDVRADTRTSGMLGRPIATSATSAANATRAMSTDRRKFTGPPVTATTPCGHRPACGPLLTKRWSEPKPLPSRNSGHSARGQPISCRTTWCARARASAFGQTADTFAAWR